MGALALLAVLFIFQALANRPPRDPKGASPGAPVRVAVVERDDMPVIAHSLGTVLANTLVQVAPLVSGTLETQAFREGQFVHKGDLLFQIDAKPFQAALAQAEALYRRDQAQLKNAIRDKQRFDALLAQDSVAAQTRDTAAANVEMLTATVAADKANLDVARLNLAFTQIRAPVNGKTGPVLIQPGNAVSGGGASLSVGGTPGAGGASAGPSLVTLAEVQPVKVSFTLPESDLPRIQAQQAAGRLTASIEAPGGGPILTAPVTFASNAVNSQSGTLELRATFPNRDLSLVPGEMVNVTVTLDTLRQVLIVPRDAVNDSPSGPYVFVLRAGKAERRSVTVLFDNGHAEAVSGDLQRGDKVVTEGQLRVSPGSKVHILPKADPSDSGPGDTGLKTK